jgi:hypothetical protein
VTCSNEYGESMYSFIRVLNHACRQIPPVYEEEDGDDLDDLSDTDDKVHVSSTDVLVDNMRYILAMPEICDVTVHVGPQPLPVHGLNAVIGSSSQLLQDNILQLHNQQLLRRSKKRENNNLHVSTLYRY